MWVCGAKYYVTFLDEATGYVSAIPIKKKNEASNELLKFVSWNERQRKYIV